VFLVIEGLGWAMGAEGQCIELTTGQGVFIERGECHSKGSDSGMVAIMIRVSDLEVVATPFELSAQ